MPSKGKTHNSKKGKENDQENVSIEFKSGENKIEQINKDLLKEISNCAVKVKRAKYTKKMEAPSNCSYTVMLQSDEKTAPTAVETTDEVAVNEIVPSPAKIQKLDGNTSAETAADDSKYSKFVSSISPIKSDNSKMSLKSPARNSITTTTNSILYDKLRAVLSNLYLNVVERMKLQLPPRCAEDLNDCRNRHYHADMPEQLKSDRLSNLSTVQQHCLDNFFSYIIKACSSCIYPGDGILTTLVEIILSRNPSSFLGEENLSFTLQSIETFHLMTKAFPVCWRSLRQTYMDFFKKPISNNVLTKDNDLLSKSNCLLGVLFDLLEDNIELCTEVDMRQSEALDTTKHAFVHYMDLDEEDIPKPTYLTNVSCCSEIVDQVEWEEREQLLQNFQALSREVRIHRLFIVLELLLKVLEDDLVMWLIFHHKDYKEFIFHENKRPLVVQVFQLSKFTRASLMVKRLFIFFAMAVNKRMSRRRLEVLERYIGLVMVASNAADIKTSDDGIKFPDLGANTKTLIREFFNIFKAHNPFDISSYMNTISLLRIPFVRFEFIDIFLQMFNFPANEEISPKKISLDLLKKRWQKLKSHEELAGSVEDLSREQYLSLLLMAFKDYMDWHGTKILWQLRLDKTKIIAAFQMPKESKYCWRLHGAGKLMVDKMEKDIEELEIKLKKNIIITKPKMTLPLAKMCVDDEILTKYKEDMKFITNLCKVFPKIRQTYTNVDWSEWQIFLEQFSENSIADSN